LVLHPAKAATERAAVLELEFTPSPYAQILWHAMSIVACDLERIRVFRDKPVITFSHEDGEDFSWLDLKPFPHLPPSCEIKVELPFKSRIIV